MKKAYWLMVALALLPLASAFIDNTTQIIDFEDGTLTNFSTESGAQINIIPASTISGCGINYCANITTDLTKYASHSFLNYTNKNWSQADITFNFRFSDIGVLAPLGPNGIHWLIQNSSTGWFGYDLMWDNTDLKAYNGTTSAVICTYSQGNSSDWQKLRILIDNNKGHASYYCNDTLKVTNFTARTSIPSRLATLRLGSAVDWGLEGLIIDNLTINYFSEWNNSINVSIFDEASGNSIVTNITLIFKNAITEYSLWTTSGWNYTSGQFDGDWTVQAYSNLYDTRYYALRFVDGESKNLSIYLSNTTETVTFILKDSISGDIIEGALLTAYRPINGSLVNVFSKISDVTGKVEFNHLSDTAYAFKVSGAGYQEKNFTLDPITQTEYTVLLRPLSQYSNATDHYGILAYYSPHAFYNGVLNNFSFTFKSIGSLLTSYSMNVTYPGGATITNTGTNPTGETFLESFNITGATFNSTVCIGYTYTLTIGSTKTYRYCYYINNATGNAGTMLWLKSNTYGMGLLERLLIMTIIAVFLGAIVVIIAGMEAGLVTALIMEGFLAYLLDINVLFLIPSFLAGILLIAKRTT